MRKRTEELLSDLIPWSHQGHRGRMAAAWTHKSKRRFSADDWRTFTTASRRWASDVAVDVHAGLLTGVNVDASTTMRK